MAGDIRQIVGSVFGALRANPVALIAFGAAFVIVLLGGSALTFVVKGGTVAILAAAEAQAGPIERPPLRLGGAAARQPHEHRAVSRRLPDVLAPLREARRRACSLVYTATAVVYLGFVVGGYALVGNLGVLLGLVRSRRAGAERARRLDHARQLPLPADADGDRGRGRRRPRGRCRVAAVHPRQPSRGRRHLRRRARCWSCSRRSRRSWRPPAWASSRSSRSSDSRSCRCRSRRGSSGASSSSTSR